MQIAGVILAGGASRRMGGVEKAFLTIGGEPMIARIARTMAPQCRFLAVSAQGDLTRFGGLPTIADTRSLGPMAGLAQAMDWLARHQPRVSHVLSLPSDTPFLPGDLAARLCAALEPGAFAGIAASGNRLHPVIGLWPMAARTVLEKAVTDGLRSFHAVLEDKPVARVEWPARPHDPFFNINTPQDLAQARVQWPEAAAG